MESITLNNIHPSVLAKLRELAVAKGTSPEDTLKTILENMFMMDQPSKDQGGFSEFSGLWTVEEANEFNEAIKVFEQVEEIG